MGQKMGGTMIQLRVTMKYFIRKNINMVLGAR